MTEELKCCPWCGQIPIVEKTLDDEKYYYISCISNPISCSVCPLSMLFTSIEHAITAWNTRHE